MPTGRPLQIADYEQLAQRQGLDWLGNELPPLCGSRIFSIKPG